MTMTCVAGIDVGRDSFDVALAPSGRWFRAANAPKGVDVVVSRLKRAGVTRVVLESIGSYGARLVRALVEAEIGVGVVDPKRIKALRFVEGRHAKTDRLDAALIARFALMMSDADKRPVQSVEMLTIRALSTRRRQIVEMIAMEKVRLKQALDDFVAVSHRSVIAVLGAERKRIEAELHARLKASAEGARRMQLLQTIPGVGPTVAATLLADLPELGSLDRRAVASLAGLAPHPNESGQRKDKASIKGGRPCVRAALYFAALSAARSHPLFKADYQAMRSAGKPAKVVLIAIARKLLVAANGMLRDARPWTPERP